jgi:serine/threonine-protein kinase RsbW
MNGPVFKTELFIPSTAEGLDECLKMAGELAHRNNFNFDEAFSLQTILVESIENAFIHGNKGIRELQVRVLISVSQSEIFIEVEDCGDGFDFASIPSPIEGTNIHNETGRGLFFIKSLSSACYTVGKGNIIRIILKR